MIPTFPFIAAHVKRRERDLHPKSVVTILFHVSEAKATFGVGVLVIILQLQEQHAEKNQHKEQQRTGHPGPTVDHLVLEYRQKGSPASALCGSYFS